MDIDGALIAEVQKRSFIYDPQDKDYKNVKKRAIAWRAIADKLNINEARCRNRWKGLRDCHRRYRRAENGHARKWRHYDAMLFLDNVPLRPRLSETNYDPFSLSDWKDDAYKDEDNDGNDNDDDDDTTSNDTTMDPLTDQQSEHEDIVADTTSQSVILIKHENIKEQDVSESAVVQNNNMSTTYADSNSTLQHFASLAAKIKEAKLPLDIVNQIEAKVSALVFAELHKNMEMSAHSGM